MRERDKWFRVVAWVGEKPGSGARLLAKFRLEADAQNWADEVREANPKWTVQVRRPEVKRA